MTGGYSSGIYHLYSRHLSRQQLQQLLPMVMMLTEIIVYWTVRCIPSPLVVIAIAIETDIVIVIDTEIDIVIKIVIEIEIEIATPSSKPFPWLLSMPTHGSECDLCSSHLICCRWCT